MSPSWTTYMIGPRLTGRQFVVPGNTDAISETRSRCPRRGRHFVLIGWLNVSIVRTVNQVVLSGDAFKIEQNDAFRYEPGELIVSSLIRVEDDGTLKSVDLENLV